jgi:hypothetical protein
MIRTIWLATLFLAVLGALAAGKGLMTPNHLVRAELPLYQKTSDSGLGEDTLTKADRLESAYDRGVRGSPPSQPAEFAPPVALPTPTVENKIISRHWHDPNSISSATRSKSTKQTGANKKSKAADRKRNQSSGSFRTS